MLTGLTKQLDALRNDLDPVGTAKATPSFSRVSSARILPTKDLDSVTFNPLSKFKQSVRKVNLEKMHHSSHDKFSERLGIDRGDIGGVSSEREGAVNTGKSLKIASPKKGTKKENVRMVLRLSHAQALFEKYCKPNTPHAKNNPAAAKRTGSEDANKVVGSWEQRQILKNAGLDQEVSERMSTKALAAAALALAPLDPRAHLYAGTSTVSKAPNHLVSSPARKTGAMTERTPPQTADKNLHWSWVREIARALGVGDELKTHELEHGTVIAEVECLSTETHGPTANPRPGFFAAVTAVRIANRLKCVCVIRVSFVRVV